MEPSPITSSAGSNHQGRIHSRVLVGGFALSAGVVFATWFGAAALGRDEAKPRQSAPNVSSEEGFAEEEERFFAQQALRENCLICHSEQMISGQRLTSAQWKAEVEKMAGMGSPLPAEQSELLINYLSQEYSDTTPAHPVKYLSYDDAMKQIEPVPSPARIEGVDIEAGKGHFTTHCATCHAPSGIGGDLGPNLLEIASLFRQPDFREVVHSGRHRMPGFQTVLSPAQVDQILGWLQAQRYPALPEESR